ncbi:hypothetical protein [Luteococcus sediminum]
MTAEPFKPALRDRIADPGRITLPKTSSASSISSSARPNRAPSGPA